MGNYLFIIFSFILVSVAYVMTIDDNNLNQNVWIFKDFMMKYNKSYANTTQFKKRYDIFMQNLQTAKLLNSQRKDNVSAWFGINKFSDLTTKEFQDQYLSDYVSTSFSHFATMPDRRKRHLTNLAWKKNKLPQKVDWRNKGIVTPVKNQGKCGGCWAISSVEVIESAYANKTGKLVVFSAQEIIDCSYSYKHLAGCGGGLPCTAFDWLKQTQTILVYSSDYPLKNKDQMCAFVPPTAKGVRIKDYKCSSFKMQENEMLQHIATKGTLSVAVDATSWFNYQGGIIQYHCASHLNHAVQIVGYDLSGPVPYYIVKNSWGADWGIRGYLHLKVGVDICGVANQVSWVSDIEAV